MAWWESETSLSSLVSLNKNVSLINGNFQSEATNSVFQNLTLKYQIKGKMFSDRQHSQQIFKGFLNLKGN